jgi:tripartite-type tricarboxylate transporter receptor subunit TctC
MFSTAIGVPPYLQSGKLKALAVTSPDRFAMMPDLPTVAQTVPGYEAGVIQGFLAPAKTPAVVLTRLNEEIVRFLKTPGSRERFLSQGADIVGSSPEEFAAVRRADMARVAKVIEMSGLRETK